VFIYILVNGTWTLLKNMLSTAEKAWTGSKECFTAKEASGAQKTAGQTGIWLEFRVYNLPTCKRCH